MRLRFIRHEFGGGAAVYVRVAQDKSKFMNESQQEICHNLSQVKCPLATTHNWFRSATFQDSINVHPVRTNHEIEMDCTTIATSDPECIIRHCFSFAKTEFVCLTQGNMISCVLIDETMIEKHTRL